MLARNFAVALAPLIFSGCSLLIEGESTPLRCSQEGQAGPPACDVGMVCVAGSCRVSEPAASAGAPSDD
jgi:hypothetical protein